MDRDLREPVVPCPCGQPVEPPRRRYCSEACARDGVRAARHRYNQTEGGHAAARRASKSYQASVKGMAADWRYKQKRSRAVVGRRCSGCGRTDANVAWSGRVRVCATCSRLGDRNG